MRHGGHDHLTHAVMVTVIALTLGVELGLKTPQILNLAQAALLHDVGLLYFPHEMNSQQTEKVHADHPLVSAQVAVELAHASQDIGYMIACSHERMNGSGYPRQLTAAQISPSASILLFAEAMSVYLAPPDASLFRSSFAARLVSNEFDTTMVNWINRIAHEHHSKQAASAIPDSALTIGLRMRQLHAQMARMVLLLSMTLGEDAMVKKACVEWLEHRVNPLLRALRSSGVEDALAIGEYLKPDNATEAAELEALHKEIVDRLKLFHELLVQQCIDDESFEASPLVVKLLEVLEHLATLFH